MILKFSILVNIKRRMEHPDLANKLVEQLKTQQNIYRENVLEMQRLKNETDHLKHGLEQARIRIQQRFYESHASRTSSRMNFDIFDHVLEDSTGLVDNNAVKISSTVESALKFNDDPGSFSNNQLALQAGFSNVISEDRNRITDTYSLDNYLQPINECISNPNLTYQKTSFEEVPQKICGSKINDRAITFHQETTNLIYPIRQQQYSTEFTKNDNLPVINKCTRNSHQQIPDYLTRQGNQDYLPSQIENYQQKIPFDARPIYGGYMGNQDDNIPLTEVAQQTSNAPFLNQEMDSRSNLRCQYNISPPIPRNNRYPSDPIQASTAQQPGYSDLPERLNTFHYDTPSRSENQCSVNSHCKPNSNQPYMEDNPNMISQGKNYPEEMNDNEEEFLKDIPLTGDPEVDEEIIAFYKARQKAFKS